MGEIIKLVNISNEEWLALLEKSYFTSKQQEFPTFVLYVLCSMFITSLYGISTTYLLGVSL